MCEELFCGFRMNRLPNITWLRQFNVVAGEGSLLAAARRLRISQPALSKNIRSLEAELGTTLFDRHARGITLNEYGRILLARSKAIELEYAYATNEIRNLMAGNEGVVRVGAGPFFGSAVMPSALEQFHKRQPKYQIQLTTGPMENLITQLEDGKLDLVAGALLTTNLAPDFVVEKLAQIEMGILAEEKHPLAHGDKPVHPGDLAKFPFVAYQRNSRPVSILLDFFRAAGAPPPSYLVETTSLITGLELVRSGSYLMFDSKPIVKTPLGYRLVTLETEKPIHVFAAGLISRKSLKSSAPFQLLRSLIVKSFNNIRL